MKPIFIEFSLGVEPYVLSQLKELYDISFDEGNIFTNAYYTDEPPLKELVFKNDVIWMNSVVIQESQYAIDGFIQKFYENKVKGKTIVNTTGYLFNHLKRNWAQYYPDKSRGAELKYNSVEINGKKIPKWEVIKWVLDNNTIVDENPDDTESYNLYIITMKKEFSDYDDREGQDKMTPVIGDVYLTGEL